MNLKVLLVKLKYCILLLFILPLSVSATGAGPPAGLEGLLYFGLAAIVLIIIVFILSFFAVKKFYNKSKNKKIFKRILIWLFSMLILGYLFIQFLLLPGYVSLTSYKVLKNNPFEESVKIVVQKNYYYFEFSDGRILEFNNKHGSLGDKQERLEAGKKVMLQETSPNEQFSLYSLVETNDYYWFKRKTEKVILTIPLFSKHIIRYSKAYEGKLKVLDPEKPMDENYLIRALTKPDCCDVNWIQTLIDNGANSKDVINTKRLIHRFISFTDRKFYLDNRNSVLPILLNTGKVNVNMTDESKRTILQLAVDELPDTARAIISQADKEFIIYLLKAGVDPNSADEKGNTALHNSLKKWHFELSKLLIDYGANVNLVNKRGESPLYLINDYLDNDNINKGIRFFSKKQVEQLDELKQKTTKADNSSDLELSVNKLSVNKLKG